MKQQSDWMKGLLWAENTFKNNPDLDVEIIVSIVRKYIYHKCNHLTDKGFINGASDYLDYYKERLL